MSLNTFWKLANEYIEDGMKYIIETSFDTELSGSARRYTLQIYFPNLNIWGLAMIWTRPYTSLVNAIRSSLLVRRSTWANIYKPDGK